MTENSDYRKDVANAIRRSEQSYDKHLLYLSAGALGLSLVFIKNVIGTNEIQYMCVLISAWIAWGLSLLSILISYRTSRKSHWIVLDQLKNRYSGDQWGGVYNKITDYLNCATGILFTTGVALMILFASNNLEGRKMSTDRERNNSTYSDGLDHRGDVPNIEIRGETVIPPEDPSPPTEDSNGDSGGNDSPSDDT